MSKCIAHPNLPCSKHDDIHPDLPITELLALSKEQFETSDIDYIVQRTLDHVEKFHLEEEWIQLKTVDELFRFSIQYGCIEMVKVLYLDMLYKYNFSILEHARIRCPVHKKFNRDFYHARNETINYLYELRKNSRMCIFDGQFYYQYNPRHSSVT